MVVDLPRPHQMFACWLIEEQKPRVGVVDPNSNSISVGTSVEVRAMLARLIEFLKVPQIPGLFTSLTVDARPETTEIGIAPFMDTWLLFGNAEMGGKRIRSLNVLKSRGTPCSNQVREFSVTRRGVTLLDVMRRQGRVLVGVERSAEGGGVLLKAERGSRRR
jgi:circadian clock protein KaiC